MTGSHGTTATPFPWNLFLRQRTTPTTFLMIVGRKSLQPWRNASLTVGALPVLMIQTFSVFGREHLRRPGSWLEFCAALDFVASWPGPWGQALHAFLPCATVY